MPCEHLRAVKIRWTMLHVFHHLRGHIHIGIPRSAAVEAGGSGTVRSQHFRLHQFVEVTPCRFAGAMIEQHHLRTGHIAVGGHLLADVLQAGIRVVRIGMVGVGAVEPDVPHRFKQVGTRSEVDATESDVATMRRCPSENGGFGGERNAESAQAGDVDAPAALQVVGDLGD